MAITQVRAIEDASRLSMLLTMSVDAFELDGIRQSTDEFSDVAPNTPGYTKLID